MALRFKGAVLRVHAKLMQYVVLLMTHSGSRRRPPWQCLAGIIHGEQLQYATFSPPPQLLTVLHLFNSLL
jgi:hypothetical protein